MSAEPRASAPCPKCGGSPPWNWSGSKAGTTCHHPTERQRILAEMTAESDYEPSTRERMASLTPEQEEERQRLLSEMRAGASTVGERLRQRAAMRAFGRVLDRSSLGEESCWVQCPEHGRSARDPFTERCVQCP